MLNTLNLPRIDSFKAGDKLIIKRDSTFFLIDYDSVYISIDQINFSLDINLNYDNSLLLINDYNNAIASTAYVAERVSLNIFNGFSTTQSTTTGSEGTASYRNIIAIADPYSGTNNLIIINDADVQRIGFADVSSSDQCSDKTSSFGGGTIFLPAGTYRVSASISVSPEVDNISLSAADNIIAYAAFRKLTPPASDIVVGSSAATLNQYGGSITLNINGFFYNSSSAEFAMTITTSGRLIPGVTTGIFSSNLSTRSSINKKIKNRKYKQARLIIEKISDNNTLSL